MNITIQVLSQQDKKQALRVEASAMPHALYLRDVWDLFTQKTDGNLLGAFVDEQLVGIGKITRLYAHYGWLETLRVHADWQRKGIGRAIWQQFFAEIKKMKLRCAGMYTENDNIASKTLAENFGLAAKGKYTEFLLPANTPSTAPDFRLVLAEDGESILSSHYPKMPEHIVINRTFYPVALGLGRHFAAQGWLYQDSEGNLLVAGNRFHPDRLLHTPYFWGNTNKILSFAQHLASTHKAPAISCLLPTESIRSYELKQLNFQQADTFITLWIDLQAPLNKAGQ